MRGVHDVAYVVGYLVGGLAARAYFTVRKVVTG